MRSRFIVMSSSAASLAAFALFSLAGCPSPSSQCTQTSCPIGTICAGDGTCHVEQAHGEGEGEGTAGEGEGEGEGSAVQNDTFDPAQVWIVGGLGNSSGGFGVIMAPGAPDALSATSCCLPSENAGTVGDDRMVRPSDGKLLYDFEPIDSAATIRVFEPDDYVFDPADPGSAQLPTHPESNDPIVLTCPDGSTGVHFFIRPDTSKLVYHCFFQGPDQGWFEEDGTAIVIPSTCGSDVVAAGYGGAYATGSCIVDGAGASHAIAFDPQHISFLRASSDGGFDSFIEDETARTHTPMHINADGTTTVGTALAAVSASVDFVNAPARGWAMGDASGTFFRWYLDHADSSDDLVGKETTSSYVTVYDDAQTLTTTFFAGYLVTGP